MGAPLRIVVVSADAAHRATLVDCLAGDGRDTLVLDGFHAAKRALDVRAADLVIADIRLGEFNGLHLALRARYTGRGTPAIVIGEPDSVLQHDAQRQGTPYLTWPVQKDAVLAAVRSVVAQHRPTRRSSRKRVERVPAWVNGQEAALTELSYEGLRLEIPNPEQVPTFFTISVPAFQVSCRAQRMWESPADTSPEGPSGASCCGAALAAHDEAATSAWRRFVDAVAGWTVSVN